jgi:hypothetical protein
MRHLGVGASELKIQFNCCSSAIVVGPDFKRKALPRRAGLKNLWGDPHWVVKEASNRKITPEVATSPINVR